MRLARPTPCETDRADGRAWDRLIWDHAHGNIFAASPWGEYKRRVGWQVRRLTICDEGGTPLAYVQVQTRRRGPIRLVYIQGGPLLTDRGARQAEDTVARLLTALALRPFDIVAVNLEGFGAPPLILGLLAAKFSPALRRGSFTLEVDLREGYDRALDRADRTWRKDLRRAQRSPNLDVRFLVTPAERLAAFDAFAAMYAALQRRKGFTNGFQSAAYRDLLAEDPHQLVLEVRDGGKIVLVRIAHVAAGRCTDFFTASNDEARKTGAAVLAVSSLLRRATEVGCRTFDFGGIDPERNRGVYDFKRKLTKDVVQTGPLYLYARSRLVRDAAAVLLSLT